MDNKHPWDLNGLNAEDFQVSDGTEHQFQEQQEHDPDRQIIGFCVGLCVFFCTCGGCACGGCAGCAGCARCGGCGGCARCAGCGGCGGRCGGCGGRCGRGPS
ncbi:hypothetical protein CGZ90_19385 [Fictibacillus aquaticus]|uniref:Heterocycloanthracin/sonorensin family bacteriocin n=1 Tax=Fictibacillus aquaticus TaxID=2021314 RepID=A0A235F491_9BACL|nr:hypothetical protein CGZ90_19385 [Fictibacillus aquaticus]